MTVLISAKLVLWLGAILLSTSAVVGIHSRGNSCSDPSRRFYEPGTYPRARLCTCPRYSPYPHSRTSSGISGMSRYSQSYRRYRPPSSRPDYSSDPPSFGRSLFNPALRPDPNLHLGTSSNLGSPASNFFECTRDSPQHSGSCSCNRAPNVAERDFEPWRRDFTIAGVAREAPLNEDREWLVSRCVPAEYQESIYNFEIKDGQGKTRRLQKRYKGKVLLIVVTATFHPLSPQLLDLNFLQEKYDGGLKILAFPCNQFRITENGGNHSEVMKIMYYVRPGNGFIPLFDVLDLTPVNGASEAPLFTHLKAMCPAPRATFYEPPTDLKYDPLRDSDVREPYEKFLVSGRGAVVARYDARLRPHQLEADVVEEILKMRDDEP